jgi:hypothetical protein
VGYADISLRKDCVAVVYQVNDIPIKSNRQDIPVWADSTFEDAAALLIKKSQLVSASMSSSALLRN